MRCIYDCVRNRTAHAFVSLTRSSCAWETPSSSRDYALRSPCGASQEVRQRKQSKVVISTEAGVNYVLKQFLHFGFRWNVPLVWLSMRPHFGEIQEFQSFSHIYVHEVLYGSNNIISISILLFRSNQNLCLAYQHCHASEQLARPGTGPNPSSYRIDFQIQWRIWIAAASEWSN